MALEDVTLEGASTIAARYRLDRVPREGAVLVVGFAGTYRDGSAGAPDALRMAAHVAAGLATWPADAVVLDLSALAYRWGDGLIAVSEVAERGGDALLPRPIAMVTGPASHGGLASLCTPESLFTDVAAAVAAMRAEVRDRAAELERTERSLVLAILVRDDLPREAAIELIARAPTLYQEFVVGDWRTMTWRIEHGRAVVRRASSAQLAAAVDLGPTHVVDDPDDRARPRAVVLGARVELPPLVRDLPSW